MRQFWLAVHRSEDLAKGHAKPLSGAVVNGKRTNHQGIVQIVPTKAGKLTLHASKHGYIRDETSVHVS